MYKYLTISFTDEFEDLISYSLSDLYSETVCVILDSLKKSTLKVVYLILDVHITADQSLGSYPKETLLHLNRHLTIRYGSLT